MNSSISLNGLWDFVVDLDPKYHLARSYARPDWDRRHWLSVPVPGVWNRYAERYELFEGVGWFARTVMLPSLSADTTCLLRFGGVNYLSEVYVNGELAGRHEGGYTEFTLDISRLVRPGLNTIAVRVDNRSLNMKLPPVLGYFNYGGIHRDVTLEIYPGPYFAELACDAAPSAAGGTLRVHGLIAAGEARPCQVEATCAGVTAQAEAARDGRFTLEMTVPDVIPWSPDSPRLYPARITLREADTICDARELEVGFRRIEVNGDRIDLNGVPLDLRGICYLYDSPAYGVTFRPEQTAIDLALLQEAGVNAIRSHFPFPHDFLTACDRAGILVWIEVPVYCIDPQMESCQAAFTDPSWRQLALTMIEEMIRQSRAHPSVIIYGIGNECQLEAPGALDFFRALTTRARALDPTRLISYACLYGLAGAIAGIVDVVGFNEYWGWYDVLEATTDASATTTPRIADLSKLRDLLSRQAASYGKPVLLTEFGADSIPGYRSATRELWSEDYHAHVLSETLAIAAEYPFVRGTFPFVFADYRDPSKEVNGYWDGMNYKGIVTYERRKKLPFFVVQQAYAQRRGRSESGMITP